MIFRLVNFNLNTFFYKLKNTNFIDLILTNLTLKTKIHASDKLDKPSF